MPIYQTSGALTGTIDRDNVELARQYLQDDDMTKYLDKDLELATERIQWNLLDGSRWTVEAFTTRELTPVELKRMSAWISGQNSDGLGEGFEQQAFCELDEDELDDRGYCMISFDWETNDCPLVRVS